MRAAVVRALLRKEFTEAARRGPVGRDMKGGFYVWMAIFHAVGVGMAVVVTGMASRDPTGVRPVDLLWTGHLAWAGYASMAIATAATEAYVGERERRTLRSLLVLPATDAEIVAAKVGLIATLGFIGAVFASLTWTVVAPFLVGDLPAGPLIVAAVAAPFIAAALHVATLPATLAASARAKTLRAAQWRSAWGSLVVIVPFVVVLIAALGGRLGVVLELVREHAVALTVFFVLYLLLSLVWLVRLPKSITRIRLLEVDGR